MNLNNNQKRNVNIFNKNTFDPYKVYDKMLKKRIYDE